MEAQFRAKMPLGWYTVTSSYDQILGLCDTPTNAERESRAIARTSPRSCSTGGCDVDTH